MRLIDADLEIERICTICKKYGNNKLNKKMFSANDIMEIFKNSPTAYDIDNVVEQLEERAKSLVVNWEKDKYILKKDAIEIVKEGGTE